jgi:hypothetical protein
MVDGLRRVAPVKGWANEGLVKAFVDERAAEAG